MKLRLCVLGLLLPLPASAQDMPLSTIIKEGEGWHPGKLALPEAAGKAVPTEGLPLKHPGPTVFWPDGGTLVVADNGGRHLWAFRVRQDGSLDAGEKYYPLRTRVVRERSGKKPQPELDDTVETTALLMDGAYRLYAATEIGIQIFDPTGRLCGVITSPASGKVTAMAFTGPDKDELAAVVDGKTYARKMLARGGGAPPAPKR